MGIDFEKVLSDGINDPKDVGAIHREFHFES